ncbi:hypothetical protein GOP47_0007073 [Adiantum capillus-veneris]|uniref:Uncharacterized protein n=1 Tax=Adiantum capillus-veneris TaxID=13818 RepID=A0A9D4V084_ADICA|nr:hypothetical protein GOP47_0007073 [Adiantum capillus-veneris]
MAFVLKSASLLPWLAASLLLLLLVTPYLFKLPLPVCTLQGPRKVDNYDDKLSAASCGADEQPVGATEEDLAWLKSQLLRQQLQAAPQAPDEWHRLRKGINPRTREQQLADLRKYKGISHYAEPNSDNHTALPCPGELLVEEHHSNYGEPWAGGRDVFEFLAKTVGLKPKDNVLEIGCGTLRHLDMSCPPKGCCTSNPILSGARI